MKRKILITVTAGICLVMCVMSISAQNNSEASKPKAIQPAVKPNTSSSPAVKPAGSTQANDDSLVFSKPQEYEGEILFENSKNVRIHFHLAADGKKITQIEFSMDNLYLAPRDASSGISHININDASMTHNGGFDVKDGKIASNSFFIFDLTVTRACIYGMLNIEYEQNGTLMVNSPVYMVIPNITTPMEIPAEIKNPIIKLK